MREEHRVLPERLLWCEGHGRRRLHVRMKHKESPAEASPSPARPGLGLFVRDIATVVRLKLMGPAVLGTAELLCSACLGLLNASTDELLCECGAPYHRACLLSGGTCLRCGVTSPAVTCIVSAAWVPKFAEFVQTADVPVAMKLHCMNCENELRPEDALCASCGYHLETLRGYLCPLCGVAVAEEDGFCRCCGTVFREQATALIRCDFCRNFERAGMLGCRCGMPLPPTCPECGTGAGENMFCGVCEMHLDVISEVYNLEK